MKVWGPPFRKLPPRGTHFAACALMWAKLQCRTAASKAPASRVISRNAATLRI
jgi:hypothetical protein